MRRNWLLWSIAAGLSVGVFAALAGCFGVTIDEGDVFMPHRPTYTASSADTLRIQGEDGYPGARFEHGLRTYNAEGDRLAWTHVSATNPSAPPRPLVVVCGGNASDRYTHGLAYTQSVFQHGDVLIFDYPGTGDTQGDATAENFEAVSKEIAVMAREVAGEDGQLVYWGHSLGGFVCTRMAAQSPQTAAVVFEASARNVAGMAAAMKPWYLPFLRVRVAEGLASYDNVKALEDFDGPILVLGATKDRILPVELSRALYRGLEADGHDVTKAEFVTGHNGISRADGFDEIATALFDTVDRQQGK